MGGSFASRFVSVISYVSFGLFGLIWIIFANIRKKHIESFLMFNIYQAIFLSVLLSICSFFYEKSILLLSNLPYVGKLFFKFHMFFNETPIYFTFTLSGFLVTLLVAYLVFFSILGIRPKLPLVSNIIEINLGG